MTRSIRVVPSGGGWMVEIDGEAASHRYPNRKEAVQVGRRLARASRAEYVLHAADGRVTQRDSYRRDPVSIDH